MFFIKYNSLTLHRTKAQPPPYPLHYTKALKRLHRPTANICSQRLHRPTANICSHRISTIYNPSTKKKEMEETSISLTYLIVYAFCLPFDLTFTSVTVNTSLSTNCLHSAEHFCVEMSMAFAISEQVTSSLPFR